MKEIKRYVLRSKWCIHAYWVLILWSLILVYAMFYDNRFIVLVYPLSIILVMLLIQTIHVRVYLPESAYVEVLENENRK
jgi:H+/gluconate symporter-like permease